MAAVLKQSSFCRSVGDSGSGVE